MTRSFVALTGAAVLFSASMAANAQVEDNINPWQHCGIGAMIFDDNTTAAAISNVIWDSGTTAISSATTTPHNCNSKEINVANFIDSTYDVLVAETALGHGEHLQTALQLAGCQSTEQHINELRNGLHQNVSAAGYSASAHQDKAYNYYQTLQKTAVTCS